MADGNIELVIRAKNETSGVVTETLVQLDALQQAAADSSRSIAAIAPAPIALTVDDQISPAIDQLKSDLATVPGVAQTAANSLSGIAVDPIEITAIDSATPILQDVAASIDAGEFDIPPLDVTATDSASPVMGDVAQRQQQLVASAEPIPITVDDRATPALDAIQGRLAQMKAEAADVAAGFARLDANKTVTVRAKDNASPAVNTAKQAVSGLDDAANVAANALSGKLNPAMIATAGAAGIAVGGFVALGTAIFDLAESGAAFQELSASSDAVGQAFGINSKLMLQSMKEAADGTISESNLMLAANKAAVTGVGANAQQMATLVGDAKARASAFGLSSGEAFDTLITGISNAAPRMLKQLGYTIDLTEANEAYAASIGTTSDALSEQQQRAAILQAVLAQSGRIPGTDTLSDDFTRLGVAIDQARINLGVLIASNFGDAIGFIADKVNELANSLRDLPSGLEQSLSTSEIQINEWQQKLGAAMQQNAGVADFLFGTQTAGTFGPAIAEAEQQIEALKQLEAAIKLADQAFQSGVPNAEQFVVQANALAAASANGTAFTAEQRVEVNHLAVELQNAVGGMDAAAAAEANLGGAIASANPSIDEQAGKLKALWLAASGALGATTALREYEKGVEQLNKNQLLQQQLSRTGLTASPINEFLADAPIQEAQDRIKELQAIANEPVQIKAAVDSASFAAGQKAIQDALKAGQDQTLAQQAGVAASVQTTQELERQVEAWEAAGYSASQITNLLLPSMRSQISSTVDGVSEMEKAFDKVKGAAQGVIQSALNPGVGVDPNAILESMGLREDAVNENARRLADIAQNGLKDQSWLPVFKDSAPQAWADLMEAQSAGGDIRAAAARLLLDFQDGLRPDLLDKEKAKELVRRAILGDQNSAALASEIATELSTELGVSLAAAQDAANSALGVDVEGKGGASQLTITPVVSFGEGAAEEAKKLGSTIKAGLESESSLKALMQAGTAAAATWGSAFLTAVGDKVPPELIDMLTSLITPQVQARLGGLAGQTGATP
jgi:hypothetical protein